MNIDNTSTGGTKTRSWTRLYDLIFLVILLVAAYLRLADSNWGELQHQHPDEGFFTSVTYDIGLVGEENSIYPLPNSNNSPWRGQFPEKFPDCEAWGGYFDTACSPLNPHNRGHSFFAYGTLPLFMTRYLAEWTDQMMNLKLFGRQLSGLMDLFSILLIYIIASRLYDKRVALLGSLFSSLAVMQIQQSHFYTSDLFANFFIFLTLFFAVEIIAFRKDRSGIEQTNQSHRSNTLPGWLKERDFILSILFGLSFGMAIASKLNAAPLALVLPLAFFIKYFRGKKVDDIEGNPPHWNKVLIFLLISGMAAIISFRIFQPYAFHGLGLNPQWLANIREQRAQATPDADLPWNLQWADRNHLYSFENLTLWGLGLPLGILAWAGYLWMGWRCIKGEWKKHLLLWGWAGVYFGWQSLQYNPTMRYQLPIYPLLAMMAGWLLVWIWDRGKEKVARAGFRGSKKYLQVTSLVGGTLVILLTLAWALAFSSIYSREEPRIAASRWIFNNVPGPITLLVQEEAGTTNQQPLPIVQGTNVQAAAPIDVLFIAKMSGGLKEINLPHILDTASSGMQNIKFSLSEGLTMGGILSQGNLTADFGSGSTQGESYIVEMNPVVQLVKDQTYYLRVESSGGMITLGGSAVVNETDYDYPLPFRIDGYDGFGGLYRGDLNLQVYWDDNADKLARFVSILNAADYIFIPTNHQYGQITRIPERYPLTTTYYRALIGCPEGKEISWCYKVAEPGTFKGQLGFELTAVFSSYPKLGRVEINDQVAEEAFTFYDHPKVLIFKKSADFNSAKMESLLSGIDLSDVVRLTPGQVENYKDLLLPENQLVEQQAGGTWSSLFNRQTIINRFPWIGLILWYVTLMVLGWLVYPIVRAALPGLKDRGYPLARTVGLLLWAWLAWLAGSAGLGYSRLTIGLVLLLLALVGIWFGNRQKDELKQEIRDRWKYFLLAELVFLTFFLLNLGIRLGNPDLWHPYKGGERPMDFSYFNAILKSSRFPPYDPWFAGGYINYYYFGFVLVGTPVKFLGIIPSIAYNFILPTLFAMLAVNAFSLGWNLMEMGQEKNQNNTTDQYKNRPFLTGIASASAMVLAGNLGTVRMIYQGLQRIVAPGGIIDPANIIQRWSWAIQGVIKVIQGAVVQFNPGDWYWLPSRVIPALGDVEPITEFPLFTFLYSDLHAHMIVLPLTIVVLSWAFSTLAARGRWHGKIELLVGLGLGALAIGALKPTNTWDYYTYLVLGVIAGGVAIWKNPSISNGWKKLSPSLIRLILTIGIMVSLVVFSKLFYQPFSHWFFQAYGSVDFWKYAHTPLWSYLSQWGVFLFFIVSWLTWETRQWMAETPMSALKKLQPFRGWMELCGFLLLAAIFILLAIKVTIAWLVLPLAAWAGVLILRKDFPDSKRGVAFLIGTGLVLTLLVEIVVLRGDLGRMNTVFKFYLQAWVLLGMSAAVSFGWLISEIPKWKSNWQSLWSFMAGGLVLCSGLFLLLGGIDKIRDRWVVQAPHTLDSMEYMNYAQYADFGVDMNLSEDYRAIRWMQDNIQGSPVIVEANVTEYRWGSRFTIYTGLPGVVGWNWHQRQQRVLFSNSVFQRVDEIARFYKTSDPIETTNFLKKYGVKYIILGQLEWAEYRDMESQDAGLLKFAAYNHILWDEIYRDGQTAIYAVKEN